MNTVLKIIGWVGIVVGVVHGVLGGDKGQCAYTMALGLMNLKLSEMS